jgi:hypothetical protein
MADMPGLVTGNDGAPSPALCHSPCFDQGKSKALFKAFMVRWIDPGTEPKANLRGKVVLGVFG